MGEWHEGLPLEIAPSIGQPFQPGALWWLCIDVYGGGEIGIEFQSPGGVWVPLGTRDSVGVWQITSPPGGIFRLTDDLGSTRAWYL